MAIIPVDEKVFMVSNSTNTTYSGSASLKAMNEWYTMQDVTNTVRPYQVFTALLTQSGGDTIVNICSDAIQPLSIGVTYFIDDNSNGGDFTNVGAPNNNQGTFFIATGTTPNSWGVSPEQGLVCLQYNQGAPVATVLENTIGNIWFTCADIGYYIIYSNGLFTQGKTFLTVGSLSESSSDDPFGEALFNYGDSDTLAVYTFDKFNTLIDNQLIITPIEIRVYN